MGVQGGACSRACIYLNTVRNGFHLCHRCIEITKKGKKGKKEIKISKKIKREIHHKDLVIGKSRRKTI